ncbi:MAG: multicopper oxidase domain-containing protein [Bdellovibrionales bacterium]|nr:multicopper oxidase domain-containing protein [Bdellovibrionales bacterium]
MFFKLIIIISFFLRTGEAVEVAFLEKKRESSLYRTGQEFANSELRSSLGKSLQKLQNMSSPPSLARAGLQGSNKISINHKHQSSSIKQKKQNTGIEIASSESLSIPLEEKKRQMGSSKRIGMKESDTITYHLTIDYKTVNFTGRDRKAMVINGSLPAPTLYFKEGKKAIIYVTNKMDVETSVHWHGILLPNFQDGVSYLTTPPIEPGKTHKFKFPLIQSGTYWYHSHTNLQEQRGLYGAIVVEPKKKTHKYHHDLVLVLSDWTDENPNEVLRTLKRGSEWYAIKKGSALSLSEVIRENALAAQLAMWWMKMPGMDISDVYYNTFLVNGEKTQSYPQFKEGEKIRVRIINAAASTYFWLSFGGDAPLLISADGINVKPVPVKQILNAIAETYDMLITIPKKQAVEITATAQDGSGMASVILGRGELLKAPVILKPDPIQEMRKMAKMHGSDHAHHSMPDNHKDKQKEIEDSTGSPPGHIRKNRHNGPAGSDTNNHKNNIHQNKHKGHHHKHINRSVQSEYIDHGTHKNHTINKQADQGQYTVHSIKNKKAHHQKHASHKILSYHNLKAVQKTSFPKTNTLKELHFNLTGNMWRYVWSMNGKTLSKADIIKIKKGETVRIHLHNTTMMHHPMHLHGHFFRVLNKQGEYAPLKHTVDVPPMQTVTIEFDPDEEGDWIFHCHVLYHMKSGMSRVFRQEKKRDLRMVGYPISASLNMDNHWYKWGEIHFMSNRFDAEVVTTNTKNKIMLEGTLSWVDEYYNFHNNFEAELTYEYFTSDFFRVYGGVEIENSIERVLEQIEDIDIVGKIGLRYLLPLFFELDINVDNKARLQVALEYELLLFPRIELFADWEWTVDFGILHDLPEREVWEQEQEWSIGIGYIMSKNFSLIASYNNHFSWGAGLNWKF